MESSKPVSSRIAPTPSGFLHLGNAGNFALTWALVRQKGGSLRLRIDDLDKARIRREFLDDIFFTLDWLGLDWDEGPQGVEEHVQHFSQQDRVPLYEETIKHLWEGKWMFACTCSRKDIRQNSADGSYPGTCRELHHPFDHPNSSLRIKTPKNTRIVWEDQLQGNSELDLYTEMRDFVIRRKDGLPAYQIASIVDDLDHQINLIVRGEDLRASTAARLFLADRLQELSFSEMQWYHHPLLTDSAGNKLSKSEGALAVQTLREAGKSPAMVYQQVSHWLNLPETVDNPTELLNLAKDLI